MSLIRLELLSLLILLCFFARPSIRSAETSSAGVIVCTPTLMCCTEIFRSADVEEHGEVVLLNVFVDCRHTFHEVALAAIAKSADPVQGLRVRALAREGFR